MKLTNQHIQNLYKFTRQHYVYHYDVQTELVDHLANDIEETWGENPNTSFEKARDTSFKKFGVFGFMDVIEAKQKQMSKKYWKILLRFIKEWFTVPKIVITISIFLSFCLVLQLPYSNYIIMAIILGLVIYEMIKTTILRKKHKEKIKNKEKIFLLETTPPKTKSTKRKFFNLIKPL